MKHALGALLLPALCRCRSNGIVERRSGDLIGLDSFALAARYSAPVSCQHPGERLQRNYGGEAAGFR
jgi:hypothetical protein